MAENPGAGDLQRRTRMVGRPLMNMLWKIETDGFERLPDDGAAILCPNHISFIDSPFLMMMAPRNISFIGKAEYMDSWKTKYVFPALGMIPIDRSGGASAKGALGAAEEVLRRGELFGIFPEGTRTRDGTLRKGRTGAARLAMRVGCPIYPVGITGTDTIQPPGAPAPIPFRSCKISIGRPIHPERYTARESDRLAWRSMTDEVMFEIREMTGQNYVNSYAGRKAETEPTIEAHVGTVTDPPPPGGSHGRADELVGVG